MANGGGSSVVDSLEQLFVKANNDLTVVQHKLETEFEQKYPSNDLIDKTQSTLVGNRDLLQRMQARANIPVISDSDDTVYTSLKKIIDEWNKQLGLKSSK